MMEDNKNEKADIRPDRFTFFRSFWQTAEELKMGNVRLQYLEAIIKYGLYGTEPNFEESREEAVAAAETDAEKAKYMTNYSMAIALWKAIEPNIKANIKKIQDGLKGGRPQKGS